MTTFNASIRYSHPSYTYNGLRLIPASHSNVLDVLDREAGLTILDLLEDAYAHSHNLDETNRESELTIVGRYGVMWIIDREGQLGE